MGNTQTSYDDLISGYLTAPVQEVAAANAVDELFAAYDKESHNPALTLWVVDLTKVCASVYGPHRDIVEVASMLNFMKIDDARAYFWSELRRRGLTVYGIVRGDTWETSSVQFGLDTGYRRRTGGAYSLSSSVSHMSPYINLDSELETELKELMAEALRILSSIAKVENAKAIAGQL